MLATVIHVKSDPKNSCYFTKLGGNCIRDPESNVFATDVKQVLFEVEETLFHANEGWSGLVNVISPALEEHVVLRKVVINSDSGNISTTRDLLRSPGNSNIGWIPMLVPKYQSSAKSISDDDMKKISLPFHVSPLQQESLSVHHKLFGVFPKRFLKLGNNLPPCMCCMFGQSHRRPWCNKVFASKVGGSLRKDSKSKPGDRVATDQIVSTQPGLIPQEK